MLAAHRIVFFESPLLTAVVTIAAALSGLLAGEVCYTVGWRMAHGMGALSLRSRCPECGHTLSLLETIPVFSWVMQGGACRHCGSPISLAYPCVEILGAGIFMSITVRYGLTMQTLELLVLACILLVVALSALWDYTIPNACIVAGFAARVLYLAVALLRGRVALSLVVSSVVGALALGLPLLLAVFLSNAMLARDITGLGTVKLVALVGFYLGWQQGLLCVALAALIGVAVFLVSPAKLMPVEVDGGADAYEQDQPGEASGPSPRNLSPTMEEDIAEPMRLIPFAPSIVMAFWIMLLIGAAVGTWNAPLL